MAAKVEKHPLGGWRVGEGKSPTRTTTTREKARNMARGKSKIPKE